MVTRLMVPRGNAYLVTSFFDARVTKPDTFLFPPILRECILNAKPRQGEHVLVYVTSPAPDLAKLLASVRRSFVAYGFGQEGTDLNTRTLPFKQPHLSRFLPHLLAPTPLAPHAAP